MEQIKVEFNEQGKKKGVRDIIIPPEKAGLKIVINLVVTVIAGLITYYFMMPPMNLQSYDFYIFWGVIAAIYVGISAITSGAVRKPEYVPYVRRHSVVPAVIVGILVVACVIGYLVSCPFFRAKSYAGILDLSSESVDLDENVNNISALSDFEQIPLIDTYAAAALADKTLGDFSALQLESQFELLEQDSTQINYKATPYRVYPLEYGDIFKWFSNSVVGKEYNGIPGYVIVNLNTQEAELVTDYDIKYSTAEHFNENLERHLRFKYPTAIFGDISFEIDDNGTPYWVVEKIKKTVGLFGGDDVTGIFLISATDGEISFYSTQELDSGKAADGTDISWIDQAFDANLLVQQYNYLGKYKNGFWNSIFGQTEVKQTSTGFSFIAKDNDVFLYTGVTSVNSDDSILGFILINQRTKEAKFYSTTGATESAAQASAQGKVSDKGWNASFPILLNIDGQATYFMALKDASNVVKSYAMVNVKQYNAVAVPVSEAADLPGCMDAYVKALAALTPSVTISVKNDSTGVAEVEKTDDADTTDNGPLEINGTIAEIRTQSIDGTTYYYVRISGNDTYFYIGAKLGSEVVLLNTGDDVVITVKSKPDGSAMIPALDIVKADAQQPAEDATIAVPTATDAE